MKKSLRVGIGVLGVFVFLLVSVVTFAQTTEITIWFGRENFIPADRFETFHAENPHIRIKIDMIPLEEALAAYVRTFRAGNPPDIFQVLHQNPTALAAQKMVMDITPILKAWEEEDPDDFRDMAKAAWEMPSYQGVPYGMALHAAPYWYVWRSDLFDEAGIPEPETWDDALDAGRKLRSDTMLGYALIGHKPHIDWFVSYFVSMGGPFVNNLIQLDSDAGVYLLGWYQTMMRDGIVHPDTPAWDSGEARAAFMAGKAAQMFQGSNIFAKIQESLEYKKQWKAKPPLYRPGAKDSWRMGGICWPYMVSISASVKQDAVRKVFQYLSRTEIVKEVALRYQPATRMSVFREPDYLEFQPWYAELFEAYSRQYPIPVHLRDTEIYRVLAEARHEALTNVNADPKEMAARYQAQINKIAGQ
ncbi:MAG: extracellular solute-binding protein [Atribacterota bacterium]